MYEIFLQTSVNSQGLLNGEIEFSSAIIDDVDVKDLLQTLDCSSAMVQGPPSET
jgi:hypothetical protein